MKEPFVLETEIWLPHTPEEVFEFFHDAANLQAITPPWLDFKIVTPLPIEMKPGALIDYRLKLYGIPFGWRTQITSWQPNDYFVDSQLKGPYKQWVHTHRFESRDGGTWMQDRVEYKVPGGPLSPLVNTWFVRQNVEKIFEYRKMKIYQIFQTDRYQAEEGVH